MSLTQPNFRITLWEVDFPNANGWRGDQKAVVYDAKSIGVEEHANDSGSAYWTLPNDHPQIAKFEPLKSHYEISRWSAADSKWRFVAAGILNDYTTTENETVFNGLDYKAILNQIFTPITNMTLTSLQSINSRIGINGLTNAADIPFRINSTSVSTSLQYINTTVISISPLSIESYPGVLRLRDVSGTTQSSGTWPDGTGKYKATGSLAPTFLEAPMVRLRTTVKWVSGTTAGFPTNPTLYLRLYASPPGSKDQGEPPLGNTGLIGEWTVAGTAGAMTNGYTWPEIDILMFTEDVDTFLDQLGVSRVKTVDVDGSTTGADDPSPLRAGVTYSFQIYAAVNRTSGNGFWYRTKVGKISGGTDTVLNLSEVTVGQAKQNIVELVSKVMNEATNLDPESRLNYAAFSITGNTHTTHTVFSAGKPSLDYIADICDLEMGSRKDGTKALFGIQKQSNGDTYQGNFLLSLQVSSSPVTGIALTYPENIKSYTFNPGYSRVANDITVIPSDRYLSGTSGQNASGSLIIGGTASDSASIDLYGKIPLYVSKGGFVNAQAAQNEADRILNNRKIENSKQVGLRLITEGVALWEGWDVGSSINVKIKHGLTDINEPFVISGIRWFGESNGVQRLEMDLVQGTYFASSFVAPSTGVAGGSFNTPTRSFFTPTRR